MLVGNLLVVGPPAPTDAKALAAAVSPASNRPARNIQA